MAAELWTQCCIVGCGPAGATLGLVLARAGVDVVVLEKHGDFLRDFRGDDLAPSTLELLDELGLASDLLDLRPSRVPTVDLRTPAGILTIADFRTLRSRFPFAVVIPQWDFLDLLTRAASRHPNFSLLMNAEATDLLEEAGAVAGVRYVASGETRSVRAVLTVAADGRGSVVRERAGLPLVVASPPVDVLWFRLPLADDDGERPGMLIAAGSGHAIGLINRRSYWQVAYVIPKGAYPQIRGAGIEAFRASICALLPEVAEQSARLRDWDQVSLLTVEANRLRRWYRAGLLCIGDAAHAMSPVGGAGINFAIQDAVTAANLLAAPLQRGRVSLRQLRAVQRRRAWQVRLMQAVQNRLTDAVLGGSNGGPAAGPIASRLMMLPAVTALRSRVIGLGIRRLHVRRALSAPRGS